MAIILSLRGHHNSANVALRQVVELFLKHVYFHMHPVEHGWIQHDDGLREYGFQMLLDYSNRIQDFNGFSERENCLATLGAVFAECSRYVHVHNMKFFGKGALGKTQSDAVSAFKSLHAGLERVIPAVSVLCVIYQYELFLQMNAIEQKMVTESWPASIKTAFIQWRRQKDLSA